MLVLLLSLVGFKLFICQSCRHVVLLMGQMELVLTRSFFLLLLLLLLQDSQVMLARLVLPLVQLLVVDEGFLELLDQYILSLQRLSELLILK